MSRNSKTPHIARFEEMGDPRLELGTNGLRVRCSTIELVTLIFSYSSRKQLLILIINKAQKFGRIGDNLGYDGA
jgi:hypothetical protein